MPSGTIFLSLSSFIFILATISMVCLPAVRSASPILSQPTAHQKPSSMRSVVWSVGLTVRHSPWSMRQSKGERTDSKPTRFQTSYLPADGASNS